MTFGIPKIVVEVLKKEFQIGSRVELIEMNYESNSLKLGDRGTVTGVDDLGTIHVLWDSGSCLGVVYGEDHCRKVMD